MRITKLNRITGIIFVIVIAAGIALGLLRRAAFNEAAGRGDAGTHHHEEHRH